MVQFGFQNSRFRIKLSVRWFFWTMVRPAGARASTGKNSLFPRPQKYRYLGIRTQMVRSAFGNLYRRLMNPYHIESIGPE